MINFFDRLDIFMKYKGLNDNKITIETGISNGLIGKGRKRGSISQDNISKILYAYPEIDANWLLTGNGPMLRTNSTENQLLPAPVNNQPPDANTANTVPENNEKMIRELLDRLERLISKNTLLRKKNEEFKKEIEELKNKEYRPDGIAPYIRESQKVSTVVETVQPKDEFQFDEYEFDMEAIRKKAIESL